MAEGKSPPVPREDGIPARSEADAHRLEEIWPALLPQAASDVDYSPDCVGQPEGVEAPGVDDNEELQEAGPRGDEGVPASPPPRGREWQPLRSPAGPPPVAPGHLQ
jgi:hypothetical protein